MREHLATGQRIEVDVARAGTVFANGDTRDLTLYSKLDRVSAESAAIASVPRHFLLTSQGWALP